LFGRQLLASNALRRRAQPNEQRRAFKHLDIATFPVRLSV